MQPAASGMTGGNSTATENGTRIVHLTIPAKAEYITLCRLARWDAAMDLLLVPPKLRIRHAA